MKKFSSIEKTANGKKRASVAFSSWKTLWFNTGTLCNIECENCYIHSSPYNDDLVYISKNEVCIFLDELLQKGERAEIGFTGGEPFMNPEIIPILQASLKRGFETLVLTNAMHPMQRKEISEQLATLNKQYPKKLRLRVSIDSHDETHHDKERGKGAWKKAMAGVKWIAEQGIKLELAGRVALCNNENEATIRASYQKTFSKIGIDMD
ncbi:MAG: radical SAM protein, partial [Parvibaculales bacterium]